MQEKGLTIIFTGNGKGKTTAALGQVLRAAGHGQKTCIIQFIKGKWPTGEAQAFDKFTGLSEFHTMGSGFTWECSEQTTIDAADKAWSLAKEKVMSGNYDLVVLDELTYLVTYKLVAESDVLELIKKRPKKVNLVITGRNASPGLLEVADLVTEMRLLKHPYKKGIKARAGIEY
jgi:cob(I)alamin adenosyltransferase